MSSTPALLREGRFGGQSRGCHPKPFQWPRGCVIYPPPMSLAAQSGTQPLQSQVDLLSPALFPRPRHPAGWMSIPIECFTQLLLEVFSQSAPHSGHTGKSHQFAEARALLGCPPTPGTLRSAAASGKHSSCIACIPLQEEENVFGRNALQNPCALGSRRWGG